MCTIKGAEGGGGGLASEGSMIHVFLQPARKRHECLNSIRDKAIVEKGNNGLDGWLESWKHCGSETL